MNSCQSTNSPAEIIRHEAIAQGACRVGIAHLGPVPETVTESFDIWLKAGHHAGMEYINRYADLRRDPRLLLDGARSIVMCAFNYYPATKRDRTLPHIAYYAYGKDYHTVLRHRLQNVATAIKTQFHDAECRICIDTAPLMERYWAVQAGVGFIGRHSQLVVPSTGSYVLLGSILTTALLPPDKPCQLSCPPGCDRCITACPGKAIMSDSHIDANRCLSYLTIEHRGEFPPLTNTHNCLYGCDTCQKVCPLNAAAIPTEISEFTPTPELLTLTASHAAGMSQQQFSAMFSQSAIKRTKLEGLRRNALNLLSKPIQPDKLR